MSELSVPEQDVPPGAVIRLGRWAVANRGGEVRAVSARCRHQLADLSAGTLDARGCLVCPWHGARYDLDSGAMVRGPKGFLGYRGRTPGYTELIKALGTVLPLGRRAVVRDNGRYRLGGHRAASPPDVTGPQ